MPNASSFNRLPTHDGQWVTVWVEGQAIKVRSHDSAAAAVLAAGLSASRTSVVSGSARAPYCMMGVCFECLLEINGEENVQGCMTQVSEGMHIRRQQRARHLVDDLSVEVKS